MKNNLNKQLTKENKKMLSPTSKKCKNTNQHIFKDGETNKLALSQKKTKKDLLLPKKKI